MSCQLAHLSVKTATELIAHSSDGIVIDEDINKDTSCLREVSDWIQAPHSLCPSGLSAEPDSQRIPGSGQQVALRSQETT